MRPAAPWEIFEVDLEAVPLQLSLRPETRAAVLYFRFEGLVVGRVHELAGAFPMEREEILRLGAISSAETVSLLLATALRPISPYERPVLGKALGLIRDDARDRLTAIAASAWNADNGLTATIVVCTCRRPEELAGCLASMSEEIASGREIIVIDNGPDPATKAVVQAYKTVCYAPALKRGLSHARNVGLSEARGDIVVFVDDDVRPKPGWVEPILAAFAPDVDVVCGLVLPESLEAEAQIAFQYDLGFGGMGFLPLRFDRGFLGNTTRSPPVWQIGAGANMAVRRGRAQSLGGFDERIGPGAAGGCADDSEFWSRVLHSGGVCVYQPASIVYHRHRQNWETLRQQAYGYGFGHVVGLFAQFGHSGDVRDLRRALLGFPAWLVVRTFKAPLKALAGRRDRLLWAWWRGYLGALRHLPLAFKVRKGGPNDTSARQVDV